MPCNDISELIELRLDAGERLDRFSLQKDSCGAPVGRPLLAPYLHGRGTEEILSSTLAQLVPESEHTRQLDRFVLAKQLHAVQAALAAYTGRAAAGLDDPFVVERIDYSRDETVIRGLVRVALPTAAIKPCSGCGSAPHAN
jgi:hypothetical protein